jgi:hypothetical protein
MGMTRLRGTLMAAAVPLVLLGACAQPDADAAPGTPPGSARESSAAPYPDGDDLVLRTESSGGFVPADRTVGTLPAVSVYRDGRVITNGPVPAIYPGPALPNVQVQMISAQQVADLVRESTAAGVRSGTDFGRPNVADAPTTRVTAITASGKQTVAVEALSEAQANDPMLTAAQRDARSKLSAFVTKLTGLPQADGMGDPVAYRPAALAALARPWTDPGTDVPAGAAKAWPGPALPGTYLNPSFKIGCVVVTGAERDKVLAAAKDATTLTPWTVGPDKYLITFRPLLPDEDGCAVLAGRRGGTA